jgi:gentisate 1,2-dioxygenase
MNPTTGGCAMSFIDSHLLQLDSGVSTLPVRSSSNAICCAVEGAGESRVGDKVLNGRQRDIFTVPQDNWVCHKSISGSARLFIVSDRDLMGQARAPGG